MVDLNAMGFSYDPEQELRRWAIDKACEVHWDEKDAEKIFLLATAILAFVKGEEDGK